MFFFSFMPSLLVKTQTHGDFHLNWVNGSLDMKKHRDVGPIPEIFCRQGPKSEMAASVNLKSHTFLVLK